MRIAGIYLIAAALFAYAMIYVSGEKQKIRELHDACAILEKILLQIQWGSQAMPELFAQVLKAEKRRESSFFYSLCQALEQLGNKSFQEIWRCCCGEYFTFLPQEDLQALISCGDKLGKGDTACQTQGLRKALLQLETSFSLHKENFPVKQKLSYSIAGVAAAVTVIMLI